MAEICRLCASFKTIDLLVPLFDAVQSIPAKVEQCCRVNVSADDREMPQNVCKGCLDALNKSYTFAETVTMAQNTLRKAIASHTISVSSTTPTTPVPQSTTFNRAVIWDQRKVSVQSLIPLENFEKKNTILIDYRTMKLRMTSH